MSNLVYYLALLAAIVLTVGSHVLLKKGSISTKGSINLLTLSAVIMFGLVTMLIVFALQVIKLKTVIAVNALTFVLMPIASWFFLDEPLTRRGLLSSLIIVFGIIIYLSGG